ncbi:uncharacterized protein [Panulirus ornatus]|uniref:uncharacterized protein n=1 Tax=Panulirus ornatus TaxID=150431 RepID=UPI003A885108
MWTLLALTVFAWLGGGVAICVLDNKRGWNVDCGIRDSYLFRFKDYGGLKANFDFGFEVGNEEGFPYSISNSKGGHHRRNINTAQDSNVSKVALRREDGDALPFPVRRRARPGPAFRLLPPPPPNRRQGFVRKPSRWHRPRRRQGLFHWFPKIPLQGLWKAPWLGSKKVPVQNRFRGTARPPVSNHDQALDQTKRQEFVVNHGPASTFVFSRTPPAPQTPPVLKPSTEHTVGPVLGDMLKVDANTPADTDHVPSFAAKMFVVREAPEEFYPPGYTPSSPIPKTDNHVEVPRTKFFCEEQKYLPGIYADTQLGCKVFHLCLPAAMGNTLTSFLCPNMTLFDQSIMQCNWWYYVNCESSPIHYDANLPMALSYRKINAAQLSLSGISDFDSVALLSHNSNEMKNPNLADHGISKRQGKAEDTLQRIGDDKVDDMTQQPEKTKDDKALDQKQDKAVRKKRSISHTNYKNNIKKDKTLHTSPVLLRLYKRETYIT